jgi:hypothetical protein
MTPRLVVLVVLLLGLAVFLSPAVELSQEPVDLAMVTRIREEGFRNSKVMETVAYLTDVLGPRLTGSPQMKKASEWTRQQLAASGLVNARLERWGPFGRGWSFERASVHMVSPLSTPVIALPKAWTPGTAGPVRGPVTKVKLTTQSDLDKNKGKLAGRIVFLSSARTLYAPTKPLVSRYTDEELEELAQFPVPSRFDGALDRDLPPPRTRFQQKLAEFLAAEKVLATVEPSPRDGGLVQVSGGGSREKGDNPGVPALVMAAEHYNRIARLLDADTDVELELDVRTTFYEENEGNTENTVAEIPGTDAAPELVMLGAHLDSWHGGTGATDNAAGVAVAMEAVRILKALNVRPKRTIRIALWSGEEQGLLGSRAYVREHFAAPAEERGTASRSRGAGRLVFKPEYEKLSAYFNIDGGTGKVRGIYTEDNVGAAPIFEAWLAPFANLGARTVTNRGTRGTDHRSFDAVGLPAFQFIQDDVDYVTRTHHTSMDVYDRLQREDLIQASVILASFVYHAAMREERFPRKPVPKEGATPSPQPEPSPEATPPPEELPPPRPEPTPSPARPSPSPSPRP